MQMLYQCIYCQKQKPKKEFNTEHVLPAAFGLYKDNLTLIHKVCADCNKKFGESIDEELARSTIEGTQRFKSDPKKLQEFNASQHDKKSEIILQEGDLKGLPVERYKGTRRNGKEELCIKPKYDVGFRKLDGNYDFFNVNDIPEKANAESNYPAHPERINILSYCGTESIVSSIANKWCVPISEVQYTALKQKDEELLCEVTTQCTVKAQRCFAKIAFNYLAYFNDPEVMLNSLFDPIRAFIIDEKWPEWRCIEFRSEPILSNEKENGLAIEAHLVVLERVDNSIRCRISLFNMRQVIITLTPNCYGLFLKDGFGHWFNPHNKTIGEIKRSFLILKPVSLIIKPISFFWLPY